MRDRRFEKPEAYSIAPAHPKRAKTRSFRGNTVRIFRTENDADACRSFAVVEWHDSDKLLVRVLGCSLHKEGLWTFRHFGRW